MSHYDEIEEARALAAWRAEQGLFAGLIVLAISTAPRCCKCRGVGLWQWNGSKTGGVRVDYGCDEHRPATGATQIPFADIVRRANEKAKQWQKK